MSLNRREMLALTGMAAVGACLGQCSLSLAGDLPTPPASLDVGTAADYPADGVFDKFAKPTGIIIIRREGHLYACTAFCTHRKNLLKAVNNELRCPAHGSRFSPEGEASKGPASSPLVRYGISTNSDGHVIVDTTKTFEKANWNDPGAFVKLP